MSNITAKMKYKRREMADMMQNDKTQRILYLYEKLLRGEVLYKTQMAQKFGVNEKSIQRDIEDIRIYLCERKTEGELENDIIYDREYRGYRLEREEQIRLSNAEILAVTKILLDSRAFTKDEMMSLLERFVTCCAPPENQKMVNELISNEKFHYIEPHHGKVFIDKMWEIGQAIYQSQYIEIVYQKIKNAELVKRVVEPQAIMFSEYYFYLAAYIDNIDKEKEFQVANDMFPTIYRIDRIQEVKVSDKHFKIPYKNRFEEGEYRKRIQFMFGGKLQKTTFWYKGQSLEAVLDRLPTAKILEEEDGKYLIRAETFGCGIDMWLRSQGELVEVVKNKVS